MTIRKVQDFDPVEFRNELGARILLLRKEAGLTQTQLAERTGVTNEFLSRIENGTGIPSLDTLGRLARGLKLPVCELFVPAQQASGKHADRLLRVLDKLDDEDRLLVVRLAEQVLKARESRDENATTRARR